MLCLELLGVPCEVMLVAAAVHSYSAVPDRFSGLKLPVSLSAASSGPSAAPCKL